MSSQISPLLTLPFEVRAIIYHAIIGPTAPSVIVFLDHATNKIDRRTSDLPTAWLRTCRTLHAEGWTLIALITPLTWSLHPSQNAFPPTPCNQLSNVLSSTFIRKLSNLEVLDGHLPPNEELLTMWNLRSLMLHVNHRQHLDLVSEGNNSLSYLFDEGRSLSLALLTLSSRAKDMPFVRSKTRIFINLHSEVNHYCRGGTALSCHGFWISMVRVASWRTD